MGLEHIMHLGPSAQIGRSWSLGREISHCGFPDLRYLGVPGRVFLPTEHTFHENCTLNSVKGIADE
jgi:hypothetical protein